jgi:hypothetical protein
MTTGPTQATAQTVPAGYVQIASVWHSGSTLLGTLLGRHRQMTYMGEIDRLSLQFARAKRTDKPGLCGCGKPPMDCPLWSAVAHNVALKYRVDLSTHPFDWRVSDFGPEKDLKWRTPLKLLARECHRMVRYAEYYNVPVLKWLSLSSRSHHTWVQNRFFVADIIRTVTETHAVVDSSKDCLSIHDIYRYGAGVVKIIFLTRNVHGAVWSRIKNIKTGKDVNDKTREWVKTNRRLLHFLEKIPRHDWMYIKYEDLCANPAHTLQRVCDFLGHPYETAMVDTNDEDQHIIFGNPMRNSKIRAINEDLTWKEGLTPTEVDHINRITRSTAARLGYQL